MKATRDDKTFTLSGTYWTGTYPLEELPQWLAFYRRLREASPKSASIYDATIAALESLKD